MKLCEKLGESFEECAIREAKEETNLDLENMKFFHVTNNPNMDNDPQKHYITIFMKVEKTLLPSVFCCFSLFLSEIINTFYSNAQRLPLVFMNHSAIVRVRVRVFGVRCND